MIACKKLFFIFSLIKRREICIRIRTFGFNLGQIKLFSLRQKLPVNVTAADDKYRVAFNFIKCLADWMNNCCALRLVVVLFSDDYIFSPRKCFWQRFNVFLPMIIELPVVVSLKKAISSLKCQIKLLSLPSSRFLPTAAIIQIVIRFSCFYCEIGNLILPMCL